MSKLKPLTDTERLCLPILEDVQNMLRGATVRLSADKTLAGHYAQHADELLGLAIAELTRREKVDVPS